MQRVARIAAVVVFLAAGAAGQDRQDGTWGVDADGNWVDAGNWVDSKIAAGTGHTANFTTDITADRTITIPAWNIGHLVLSDAGGMGNQWIFAVWPETTDELWLNAGGGDPATITAATGVVIECKIGASYGLTYSGAGPLTLSGDSTRFYGRTTVSGRCLNVRHANALGASAATSDTVVQSGSSLVVGVVTPETITISGNGYDATHGGLHFDVAGAGVGGPVSLGADAKITVEGGATGTISGGLTIGSEHLTCAGSGTLTLSGAITGTTGLTKTEGGTLVLSGSNTALSGTIDVQAGTLRAGAGDVDTNGFTLAPGEDDTESYFSGVISGTGRLRKLGSGRLNLAGDNTYTGNTTVEQGVLALGGDNSAMTGDILVKTGARLMTGCDASVSTATRVTVETGAYFELNGGQTFGSLAGAGCVFTSSLGNDYNLAPGTDNTDSTFSGEISGNGSLTKKGSGTLTLTGQNSYTGATTIEAGTLRTGAGGPTGSLSESSAVQIDAGAWMVLEGSEHFGSLAGAGNIDTNGFELVPGGPDSVFAGVISGAGGLRKSGPDTLGLTGDNTYTGDTTVEGGTLVLGGDNSAMTGDILVETGATLEAGYDSSVSTGTRVTVEAGAYFQLHDDQTFGSLAGAGEVFSSDLSSDYDLAPGADNTSTTFSGEITGDGSLTKKGSGTLTLSGQNACLSTTTVEEGTLRLTGDNTGLAALVEVLGGATLRAGVNNSLGSMMRVILSDSATFVLEDDEDFGSLSGSGNVDTNNCTLGPGEDNTDTTFSGVISGSGGLKKLGSGTLELTGDNSYTGGATVEAGTLVLAGDNTAMTGDVHVQGGALTVAGGDALSPSTRVTVDADASFVLQQAESFGSLSGGGAVETNGHDLSPGQDDTNTTFSGEIRGDGDLTKLGSGKLTLSGGNTYTGETTVAGGTLGIEHAGALGAPTGPGTTVLDGASICFDLPFAEIGESFTLTGSGGGECNGALEFSEGATLTGPVTLNGDATIWVDTGGGLDRSALLGGSVSLPGSSVLTLCAAGIGDELVVTGPISGTGGIRSWGGGGGQVRLWAPSTFTGTACVDGGTTLVISHSEALQNCTVELLAGIELDAENVGGAEFGGLSGSGHLPLGGEDLHGGSSSFSLTVGSNGEDTTFSGLLTDGGFDGYGSLTKVGAGTLTLTGANTYGAGTTVEGGVLRVSEDANLGAASGEVTFDGGMLRVTGTDFGSTSRPVTLGPGGGEVEIVEHGHTFTASNGLSGSGALTKFGDGTLVLSGTNGYSGGTILREGTLSVSSDSNLGDASGSLTFDGGTLRITGTGFGSTQRSIVCGIDGGPFGGGGFDIVDETHTFTLATDVTGTGWLTKQGAGTLQLTGDNSGFTSMVNVVGGTVVGGAGDNDTLGASTRVILGVGTSLSFDGDEDFGSLSGHGAVDTNGYDVGVGQDGTTTDLWGQIHGGGRLIKLGAGTLILHGDNDYCGGTMLRAGTLSVSNDNNLGDTSGDLTVDGGTLRITGAGFNSTARTVTWGAAGGAFDIDDAGNTFELTQGLSGSGDLSKLGAGTLALSGNSTRTGATTVEEGVLQLTGSNAAMTGPIDVKGDAALRAGDNNSLSSSTRVTVWNAGTFVLEGNEDFGSLNGSGQVDTDGYTLGPGQDDTDCEFSGTIGGSGGLKKLGSGTLTHSGNNTYTGGARVEEGTLRLTGNNSAMTGDIILPAGSDATLRAGENDSLSDATQVQLASGTFLILEGGERFGSIDGDGDVQMGDYDLLVGMDNRDTSHGGVISGTGKLTKLGTGIFSLSGNNTYSGTGTEISGGVLSAGHDNCLGTGPVSIDGGSLLIEEGVTISNAISFTDSGGTIGGSGALEVASLTVGAGGLIAPGSSPGVLTIDGDYTQQAGAILEIELGGTMRASEYDALVVGSCADLDGTLDVALINGFEPDYGDAFDILDWGTLEGTFNDVNLPELTDLVWDTSEFYNTGVISAVPEPGTAVLLALSGLLLLRRRMRRGGSTPKCHA